MTHRTFDEQIANFNRVVSSWDINQEYKVALLGMIASLGYEHEKSITPEPHWIPVEQDTPDEERECWITPKTTSKVYCGIFTRHYGECHRTGFICDDGFMWLNTALAWMYCEVPEPYKPTVPPECEGDCGWCKPTVIEKCKGVTE